MRAPLPRNGSIISGIWLLCLLAVAILAVFDAVLYVNLRAAERTTDSRSQTEAAVAGLRAIADDMVNAETGQRGYLLTYDPAYLAPFNAVSGNGRQRLLNLRGAPGTGGGDIDRLVDLFDRKMAELSRTIEEAQAGRHEAAMAIVRGGEGRQLMEEFRTVHDRVIRAQLAALDGLRDRNLAQIRTTLMDVAGGGLAVAVLLLACAMVVTARMRRSLANLTEGIEAVTAGHLSHRVPILSTDEIGKLSASFNALAEHATQANAARDIVLRELERSNRDLDGFAYVASHDLRAPLRGIRNLVEWVDADVHATASPETLENLRLLHNRVDRLDMLLDSLLQYSRVGRGGDLPETIDTGKLVEAIVDYLAPPAAIQVTCEGSMPMVHARKAPLEQALRNLIANAVKHHDRADGRITVAARDLGNLVEFRVTDDGPGISPQFHERIFQMFQTLRPRDHVEGSGMGLAIVKKAVEANGGTVGVESAPPTRGCTFVFTWAKRADERGSSGPTRGMR